VLWVCVAPAIDLRSEKWRNDENRPRNLDICLDFDIPRSEHIGAQMLRIDKTQNGETTLLHLSGRIQAEDLSSLQLQLEQLNTDFIFNLNEIQLVDESAVRFLTECESRGAILQDCPAYIREWIRRVGESK